MEKNQGIPRLTALHKKKRFQFAKDHMHWIQEWQNVIFSDEKKFNLDGPDCYSYYLHHLDAKGVTRSKRNFGGGTVMVWGAFCYPGKLPICFISTHTNSDAYVDLLGDVLINYIEHKSHNDFNTRLQALQGMVFTHEHSFTRVASLQSGLQLDGKPLGHFSL